MSTAVVDSHADLIIRPAQAGDAGGVVAFCRHIWSGNDYVNNEVFDAWLNQVPGPMLVGELAGRPVALSKVAVYNDGHAWFQGLRVDPDVQGRGVARRMHEASEQAAAAAGATHWALLTADAGPTAVQRLCDGSGWTIQGRTRYLHLLPDTADSSLLEATALEIPGVADLSFLQASLADSPTLAALGGWYTLDWECEPFTIDKLHAHLRAGQVWALPNRRAWAIVTVEPSAMVSQASATDTNPHAVTPAPTSGYAWWAFAAGDEPDLTRLARALHHKLCQRQGMELSLHVPVDTPWDRACHRAAYWRDPNHPPKQFRLYTKTPP